MLPLKALLVSTGIISMAVTLKLSLPVILDFLTFELPLFWSLALSWLRPPYLYLLINCIIISIVASSKLKPHDNADAQTVTSPPEKFSASKTIPAVEREDAPVIIANLAASKEEDVVVFGYVESPVIVKEHHHVVTPVKEERGNVEENDDEFVLSKVALNSLDNFRPPVIEHSPVSSAEKPPFSSRFGHRRAVKPSPEGKTKLRVTKPKKQETLESTWRTITDGRSMPLTRHLRKSDTFSSASSEASSPVRVMKKSDTFSGGNSPAMSWSARREPSMSQDELNRRVEAFIKKFNEEMRLQRQESLNQYKVMVGRGSH